MRELSFARVMDDYERFLGIMYNKKFPIEIWYHLFVKKKEKGYDHLGIFFCKTL
jgi:hypothetical protein